MIDSNTPSFVRLLGTLNFVERLGGVSQAVSTDTASARPSLAWDRLSIREERAEYDEDLHIPEDYEQPTPLSLQILFEPEIPGIYDAQWVAREGAEIKPGDVILRAYRTTDGSLIAQMARFPMRVLKRLASRNRRLVRGDAIILCAIPSLAVDLSEIEQLVHNKQMELAQAVNAMAKGFMSFVGEGGQVAKSIVSVNAELRPELGYESLLQQIAEALSNPKLSFSDGDVIVLSEKIFAIAQNRLFPLRELYASDPKTADAEGRSDLVGKVRDHVPDVTANDLLCADSLLDWPGQPMATAGVANPNHVAADVARTIEEKLHISCDVVISDTDTGLDVRETLINAITIGATPLGATAGLVIYECMRVAAAGEFCRGSSRRIPIVVCKPHARRQRREGTGKYRGYPGRLDAKQERLLGFA